MSGATGWKVRFQRANLIVGRMGHSLLTVALIAMVGFLWYRASRGPEVEEPRVTEERAVAILRNLQREIDAGAAEQMQVYFPEGACFLHTLYGLAWANVAATDDALRENGLMEIRRALKGQESRAALEPFRWDTQVRRGAFWLGQRNFLLGRYLQLKPVADEMVTSLTKEFQQNAGELHQAFMEAPVHQLESYSGMCWPADAPMGLASLAIHDEMFGTSYSEAMTAWTDYHKSHGWNGTALPAGKLDFATGTHQEPARGCATSLMIGVLAPYFPEFTAQLYADYTRHFLIGRLGFNMLREYPEGHNAQADVDSGPIVWGAGVTATGVGLAAARAVGDTAMERDIRDLSDMLGMPMSGKRGGQEETRYLFGALPMGDAFLAWGYSTPRAVPAVGGPAKLVTGRWVFHGVTAGMILVLVAQWVLLWRLNRRRLEKLRATEL